MYKKIFSILLMIILVTILLMACVNSREDEEASTNNDPKIQSEKKGYGIIGIIEEQMKILEKIKRIEEEEIIINNQQTQYTSFAIFGVGNLRDYVSTTGLNAIMILSKDNQTQEIKIVSIYKDTLLKNEDDSFRNISDIYSEDNVSKILLSLNMNLDLNITNYIKIDFFSLSQIIDLLDGIKVTISEKEAKEMNRYIDEISKLIGKKSIQVEAGEQNLDGIQTIAYSYISKTVGDDYARTERQQIVTRCIIEKIAEMDLSEINNFINRTIHQIDTNYSMTDLLVMCKDIQQSDSFEGIGFPIEKTSQFLAGNGNVIIPTNLREDVESLHKFLYPTDIYNVGQKIIEIEKDIKDVAETSN